MRAPISLAALAATLLAFIFTPAATAYEPFKVAEPALGALVSKPIVTGPNWVAYFQAAATSASTDKSQLVVMDTATRLITHTIPCPPNLSTFGVQMVTDGNYIATLSYRSTSNPGSIVHVWKLSGATYVGSLNGPSQDSSIFIGLGNGRLVSAITGERTIRQFNAADLSPLPDITLPENGPSWTSPYRNFTVEGDDLVLASLHATDIYHLLHVKLSTGAITELPVPPDFGNRSLSPSAVANGRLIALASVPNTLNPPSLIHYDLATGQVVAETPLPGGGFTTRAFLAPDASSWAAVSLDYFDYLNARPSELRTGSVPEVSGTTAFQLPPDSIVSGNTVEHASPFAYSQGHLWFSGGGEAENRGFSSGVDAEGIVAYRIPLLVRPVATLTARCLPCQESDGRLHYLFTLSHPVSHDVSINVRTASDQGTATPGVDYQPVETTVTFPAGQTQALLEIPLIQDQIIEENETLVLLLTGRNAEIHAGETQYPGVIGGSSFHRLPPVGAWEDAEPLRVHPYSIGLAGDHLVQTNIYTDYFNVGTAPRVLTRHLIGGAWTPSASLASITSLGNGIYTNETGIAALTSAEAVRFYEPATDTLRFQTEGNLRAFLGDTHVLTPGTPLKEYSLDAPYASRPPVAGSYLTGIDHAAYAQDVLIAALRNLPDGGLHMISRTTSADLGQLIPGWKALPSYIAAGGNIFAAANSTRAWFRPIDQPGRLRPLRPAFGPLVKVTGLRVSGNRILVTDIPTPAGQPPSIRIFDGTSGIEIGTLLADRNDSLAETDFSAYLPEGLVFPANLSYLRADYSLRNLTTSGKNIVAAITWPQIKRDRHLVAAAFTQEANLPGIVDPSTPITEGRDALTFTLTEAAPFPLVVSALAIPTLDNRSEDWIFQGNAYIPAGATTFTAALARVNDSRPANTIAAPIELTISGNGITRTVRTAVQILDDDRMPLDGIAHTIENLPPGFTPVAGGWAYRTVSEEQQNLVNWSEDPDFTHGSSFGAAGNPGFASAIASAGDWLAVSQDAFALSAKKTALSQIQIYHPATTGNKPIRVIKGMKDINNFGQGLYIRDNTLWVGALGSNVTSPKPKTIPGQVLEYNLTTGKKTRTYKAPKGPHAVGFGTTIAANDTSVWVGSPVTNGALFHYSRAKGKLLHSVISPDVVESRVLGRTLAATNTGMLLASSDFEDMTIKVLCYSESTGQLLWKIEAPEDHRIDNFTLIGDDILVTGGDSLIFYRLVPGSTPELLLEVLIPGADVRIRRLAASDSQLAIHRDQSGTIPDDTIIIDLADIEKIAHLLPNAPTSLTDTSERSTVITPPLPPVLTVVQSTPGHWQLQLPSPAEAAASNTTVQVSTDLSEWKPLATPGPDGTAWQLLPGTPLEAAPALLNGTTLQVPPNLPQLFFRLHTP